MRFYTQQHRHYCGIDLHARMMYLCVLDSAGAVRLSRNIQCTPQAFLAAVKAFRDDLVVAVECMFTWYWLADLCEREGIALRSWDTRCTCGPFTEARPRTIASTHTRSPRCCAEG
jgi:hypothetical protein